MSVAWPPHGPPLGPPHERRMSAAWAAFQDAGLPLGRGREISPPFSAEPTEACADWNFHAVWWSSLVRA
jgi:hypothetical protein